MFEKCEYVTSIVSRKHSPNNDNRPEIVFLGRSNVGKSSLINLITNRKMLAKTSALPGKTVTINFYNIDDSFYLVDVPGYGYARRSKEDKERFGKYLEDYLTDNPNIKVAFLLVDTKVGPTNDDLLMFEYLLYLELPIMVVATKSDKVNHSSLEKAKKQIREKLNLTDDSIIYTSSFKKIGRAEIIDVIQDEIEKEII
ncbi:MAG TPA: ribosome biogenesis GTP-binding protein YihA/YsxC [Bacilli bacterium]|jgi:GTP-binding protein|nr:ribosome biogenesis GTP-binding protein YihA/YsxC [Bacilli bacterium]HQM17970.1 ribosome biogenesis GTP-binding protein YihA/YsxC [Bacilli bacterium]